MGGFWSLPEMSTVGSSRREAGAPGSGCRRARGHRRHLLNDGRPGAAPAASRSLRALRSADAGPLRQRREPQAPAGAGVVEVSARFRKKLAFEQLRHGNPKNYMRNRHREPASILGFRANTLET